MINEKYAATAPEISLREKNNYELARKVAEEGFVLLKNEGVLPLSAGNIALYGIGARKTIKGGTGSGEVNERYTVSIEQGLENEGFKVTSKAWLDDYDAEYDSGYKKWHDYVEDKIAGLAPYEALARSGEEPFRFPSGRLINDKDIEASHCDTAVYVVARQAGEGHDRKNEPGDYQLTEIETANLKKLSKAYEHTILIINVGGLIELSVLDEISGIDAVVFYNQGGMEGGNALARLICGKENFSGKLTDTWAASYENYPCSDIYSHMNGNLDDEDYLQGIYVGYRYFDSFNIAPRFPFGYGLSYTHFDIDFEKAEINGDVVKLSVNVKNSGPVYSGKEVIQLYASCPKGKLAKEKQRLVAFTKSKLLSPGETQAVSLSFNIEQCSSYDEETAAWILEKGYYMLHLGNSSANTATVAAITLDETIIVEQCRSCCGPEHPLTEMQPPAKFSSSVPESLLLLPLKAHDLKTVYHSYDEPPVTESSREAEILNSLSPAEMAELLRGGNVYSGGNHTIIGACGKTAITLHEKGIGNIVFADGPAGLNITNCFIENENGEITLPDLPEKYNFGSFAEMTKKLIGGTGTRLYRYATAWPAHMLLAQTWNVDLIEQVAHGIGQEMLEFGISLWLAPGMNIQLNPLCGRNFEYFSEDPFLTGKMAAAVTKGVQSHSGVGVTIKHFACNNQEDNRGKVSANINERALREIYLKGFEIAVKEGRPLSLMTSYNRLNKIYTANRHDLCTDILRCEWGFDGMVMTDWGSCAPGQGNAAMAAPAGNDLLMPGTDADKEAVLAAVNSGEISSDALRRSACRILRIILSSEIYS